MIFIFLLCIKLSLLHLCVSNLGYQCTTDESNNIPEIFLIDDNIHPSFRLDSYRDILNSEFIRLCSHFYDIKMGSLEDAEKYDNVIQFAAPDYYDGKPLKNFVYAGNISKTDDAVCTKTGKAQPEFDCHEIVNLVSKSVLEINDGHVYNFVQKMNINEHFQITHEESCNPFFQNTLDLMVVLLCLPETYFTKAINIQPLKLVQVSESACSYYLNQITIRWEPNWNRNRLLAVLVPEPFEVPSEYSVPTIFYETPYLFSEHKTAFPNSMNLVPWRLLKYGFLMFIQTVGWHRVAIVTDDSEYSLHFEEELTALFNKERIVYTVIRCEDANCEMDKIKQELNSISARIVIANVEEKHAQYLIQNAHHHITWLVRDMAGEGQDSTYLSNGQVAFSISLNVHTDTKGCGVEDNILTGLSSVAHAYKKTAEEDYKGKKREFFRRFADNVKHLTPRITEATVVVRRLYGLEVVSTMYVNTTGAKLISFTNPFKSGKPTDGTAHCLLTSYDYHDPCEDPLVMFLMLTLMLFLLTFILIVSYFDKTSPLNDIRYQKF